MKKKLLILLLVICGINAYAEIKLPSIISDNMVLQRDVPARIWGTADPGEEVTVEFASSAGSGQAGQKKTVKADKDGNWEVKLDPMKASAEGRDLKISSSTTNNQQPTTIHNVVVGEVWHASGQSNMQWSLMGDTYWKETEKYPPNDMLRLFKQRRNPQGKPAFDPAPDSAWATDNSINRRHFSAVAYFFARDLQKALGVPVGISLACEGGTRCQYWTPLEAFKEKLEYKEWLDEAIRTKAEFEQIKAQYEAAMAEHERQRKAGEKPGRFPPHFGRQPSYYYNGNIHPIQKYTIRGAIWYQGERNSMTTKDAYEYRTYFPLMIESWRKAFENPDMPFYFVQLPKMGIKDTRDSKVTRESQMLTAKNLKNTGMVVTIDTGDPGLHPKLKRPIGQRMAKLALAKVYGNDVEYTGPMYKGYEVKGSTIVISFDNIGKGLMSKDGKALAEFTICGEDKNFVEAEAKIVGDTVVVSNPQVSSPVAVRFGWKNAPFTNLFGKNGLPVGPFRTDKFELPEKNPPRK